MSSELSFKLAATYLDTDPAPAPDDDDPDDDEPEDEESEADDPPLRPPPLELPPPPRLFSRWLRDSSKRSASGASNSCTAASASLRDSAVSWLGIEREAVRNALAIRRSAIGCRLMVEMRSASSVGFEIMMMKVSGGGE